MSVRSRRTRIGPGPRPKTRQRRAAWFALIAGVLVVHAMLGVGVAVNLIGWNSDEPRAIQVAWVHQVLPSAPPLQMRFAPPPAPPRPPRIVDAEPAASAPRAKASARTSAQARAASGAASSPGPAASSSREALEARALALAASVAEASASSSAVPATPAASAAALASLSASEAALSADGTPASAAASASAALASAADFAPASSSVAATHAVPGPPQRPFEWPPSTRLTYTLTGQFRNGPLYGRATVDWRREAEHYQVQFDIHVSPIFDQRMFSDGRIAEDGLRPRHYDESFKMALFDPRVHKVEFGEDDVTLSNGNRVARLAQSQDSASQFVQLVWMFTQHPEWLAPGQVVDIPLALPNNLRRWHYQVVGGETLTMTFGDIEAVHLKPILDGPRRANEYPFEIWMAPTLQYLPVRIRVLVDDVNYAELSLDSLPLQAGPDAPPGRASAASGRRGAAR